MRNSLFVAPPHQATDSLDAPLRKCMAASRSRLEFWTEFIQCTGVQRMAEIGVYRGDFAAFLLQQCQDLTRYYMIDPWRHLNDWNKPANQADLVFSEFFQETKAKTEFAAAKRLFLRGKTTEVIDKIADGELDLAYIDADHTLKGITIDMTRVYPKVRVGGFLGGDDFSRSIWEHKTSFEPTLVFPYAVYFAEAVGATIYALPYSQFVIQKPASPQFAFVDLTGQYSTLGLQQQMEPYELFKLMLGERFPLLKRAASRMKSLVSR
jgi:predicted O-methyltransferase YrrM